MARLVQVGVVLAYTDWNAFDDRANSLIAMVVADEGFPFAGLKSLVDSLLEVGDKRPKLSEHFCHLSLIVICVCEQSLPGDGFEGEYDELLLLPYERISDTG